MDLTYITSGQAKIDINGMNVFTQNVFSTMQTSATGQIGAVASGEVKFLEAIRYDNVEIAVTRAP